MAFNTLDFLLLFTLTAFLYYILPHKLRNPLLLLASYVFYAAYNLALTLFLLLCTLFTYFIGLQVDRQDDPERRKSWAAAGVVIDLGALAFYKYFNFLLGTFSKAAGAKAFTLDLIVPLGISFIIFQVVSYIIDVYRRKMSAEKSLFKFSLYVAFFPKLVQGPIERAADIIPQFEEVHSFNDTEFREGLVMFLYGLFMKMVVADRAAVVVNKIYGSLSSYSGAAIAFASALFAFQIYCDFAGYSYTAIGAAKILGFRLKQNFRQPYMSLSVSEFWRRWHISLNNWLRDYLYIPLGGSRCSPARRNCNLLVTFGLSGLWHGADWGYVIWGLLNAVYMVIGGKIKALSSKLHKKSSTDASEPAREKSKYSVFLIRQLKRIFNFCLITFSWIFFRAQTLPVAFKAISRIFTKFNFIPFIDYVKDQFAKGAGTSLYGLDVVHGFPLLLVMLLFVIIIDFTADKHDIPNRVANGSVLLRWPVYLFLIFAILIFGVYGYGYSAGAFIYAGF